MPDQNDLYRLLFEYDSEAVLLTRPQEIIASNQQALTVFNCRQPDMLRGQSLAQFAATPEAADLLQTRFAHAQTGRSEQFAWLARCTQGNSFPVRLTLTRLATPSEMLFKVVIQPASAELEPEHYRFIIENAGDMFARYKPDGVFQYVSEASSIVLGYKPTELIGRSIYDFFHPDDLEQVQAAHMAMMTEPGVQHVIYRFCGPDGVYKWVESNGRGIWDAGSNQLLEIIATTRDIDAQQKSAEALRSQAESLTVINQIANTLYGAPDLNRAVHLALEHITAYARAPLGALFTLDEQAHLLRLTSITGLDITPQIGVEFPLQGAMAAVAQVWNEIVIFADLAHEARMDPVVQQVLVAIGMKSAVSVPMLSQNRVVGVISLAFSQLPTFTATQQETLLAIGKAIGLAVTNARYLEQLETEIAERKHLEATIRESLQRRSKQMQLITRISQEITHTANLETLYQRVVDLVQEEFGYYHTQLFRVDPARAQASLVVGYGTVGAQMLARRHALPLGTGLVGVAAATGRSMLRPDVSADPSWQPNDLLPETRGELAVPIQFGDNILGVLDIQSRHVGQLSAEDQIVLEGLCGQIASAIESTRLSQNLEEQVRELQTLQRLVSREGWRAYQSGKTGQPLGYLFDQTEVRPLSSLPALQSGNDAPPLPAVTHPIAIRGQVIGALGVTNDPHNPLSQEEQALIDAISGQVAEALETARLLETTQRRAVELETVTRLSTAASTILDSDKLLQTVVELTRTSFKLYHVDILLYDANAGQLTLAAAAGPNGAAFMEQAWPIPLNLPESVIARAARTQQGVLVNDIQAEEAFLVHPLLPDTRSELAVPMIASNRLLGVLDLQSDVRGFFSPEDLQIHSTLAAQVAVALQNAQLYQEQLETARKLREVEQLKSQFLANMSHELRTPLNSIIGFSDVILEGLDGPMTPRMEEDVRIIRNSGRHLRELIGEILDMSKIEAGMMQLRYETIDLSALMDEVIATSAPLAAARKLELRLEMPSPILPIQADPTRLRQILLNLVGNAIKFTNEGWVCVQVENRPDSVQFNVIDTGIGIEEDKIPIVFEEFRQVDGSLTRKTGGTGLGVPISRRLVELHGGQIGVKSIPNEGSTFWFTIPR